MDKAHVEELASKHAALHAHIDEEEHRPLPDDDSSFTSLKKEKLRLKDELAGHLCTKAGFFVRGGPMRRRPGTNAQSSRDTFSIRSWCSCASRVMVAIGRASRRASEIGSPVTSQ